MKLTLFGATGAVGSECLKQSLEAGHEVTVLVRTPSKLPAQLRDRITVVQGDGLSAEDVARALPPDTDAILFAIGVDARSPEDLCTDVTRHILAAMSRSSIDRLVWCGGGSTLVEQDEVTLGARFVAWFAATFMGLRHRDKAHQLELLRGHEEIAWLGVRPLQIRKGPKRAEYRLGFHRFSGMSWISFADVAHSMLGMLEDDNWLHKAPIVQY
jgi:putative NADH-flavin reductase